jgi:hypothetical protein
LHRLNEYRLEIDELNNGHEVDVIGIDVESHCLMIYFKDI